MRTRLVTIMNQVAFPVQDSVHCVADVSADLTHPESTGAGCYARDLHLPTRQIQEEQDQQTLQTLGCPDLDRKEIRGHYQLPVSFQKFLPCRPAIPFRRWLDPVPFEN